MMTMHWTRTGTGTRTEEIRFILGQMRKERKTWWDGVGGTLSSAVLCHHPMGIRCSTVAITHPIYLNSGWRWIYIIQCFVTVTDSNINNNMSSYKMTHGSIRGVLQTKIDKYIFSPSDPLLLVANVQRQFRFIGGQPTPDEWRTIRWDEIARNDLLYLTRPNKHMDIVIIPMYVCVK